MEKIKDFKLESVPVHKIAFVTTSEPDYSMDRVLFVENYPDYGQYTIVSGGHCSCYDFDEASWDAITYTKEEILKLLLGWQKSSYSNEETLIAPLIQNYLQCE